MLAICLVKTRSALGAMTASACAVGSLIGGWKSGGVLFWEWRSLVDELGRMYLFAVAGVAAIIDIIIIVMSVRKWFVK